MWVIVQDLLLFLTLYMSSRILLVVDENQKHVHTNFLSALWQKIFVLDHLPFPQTKQGCCHLVSTTIVVHDTCRINASVISSIKDYFHFSISLIYDVQHLQCLWWFSTIAAAFGCSVRSSIIARVCATSIWSYICRPVSANALPIHPSLTFTHSREVNCNWTCAGWSSKGCLIQHELH